MYQTALPINLGFSSPAVFWGGVQEFVGGRPLEFTDPTITNDPITIDRLQDFQIRIHEKRGVDLAGSLSWQRQFALHGAQPNVLSTRSELGQIFKIPEETRNQLWEYANQRVNTDIYGDPNINVQLIGLGIALSHELKMKGPDLALHALEVFYQTSLLTCNYVQATLASLSQMILLTSLPDKTKPREIQVKKATEKFQYATLCHTLSISDIPVAIGTLGHILQGASKQDPGNKQPSVKVNLHSNVLECIHWLVDQFTQLGLIKNFEDINEIREYARGLMAKKSKDGRDEIALGLSAIVQFFNPALDFMTVLYYKTRSFTVIK